MYFDRFDILAAWFHYLNDNHGGQWSREYRRLSKLLTYYQPSPGEEFREGLSENAAAILERLERCTLDCDCLQCRGRYQKERAR